MVNPLKSGTLKVVVPFPLPQGKKMPLVLVVTFEFKANVTVVAVLAITVVKPGATQDNSTGIPIQKLVVSERPFKIGLPELQNTACVEVIAVNKAEKVALDISCPYVKTY